MLVQAKCCKAFTIRSSQPQYNSGLTEAAQPPRQIPMNNTIALTVLALGLFCVRAGAQEKVIRLYEGPAPGSENWQQEEKTNRSKLWQTRVVFNVVNPTLTVFQPTESRANGTAVVICPGGGFHALARTGSGCGRAE